MYNTIRRRDSIDILPDSCLFRILLNISNIHDIIDILQVSPKWERLMRRVCSKVRYLIKETYDRQGSKVARFTDTVFYLRAIELVSAGVKHIFPNLLILDIAGVYRSRMNASEYYLLQRMDTLKGVMYKNGPMDFNVASACPVLEWISIYYLWPCGAVSFSELKLKQLFVEDCFISYPFSPSLIRLHITEINFGSYSGPNLEDLKILELGTVCLFKTMPFPGFSLINKCPSLESLFLRLAGWFNSFEHEIVPNNNVVNLVLESYNCDCLWIHKLLVAFPNIKHLALRGNELLTDKCIDDILQMLPNLVLLDARDCYRLTENAQKSVENFNKTHGKDIKFYYKNDARIIWDWPSLDYVPKKIARGMDFMKNCFLQTFEQLPHIMDNYPPVRHIKY